jgi:hypothetical protein
MLFRSNLLTIAAFVVGLVLLLANCIGAVTPLRNPRIYDEPKRRHPSDVVLSADAVWQVIDSPIKSRQTYVRRVTQAVNQGVVNYWDSEGIDEYHLRVPFCENYILFLASHVWPEEFEKYEFMDYRRALRRGVGLCSEQAIILAGALESRGIPTRIIGLGGHVVAAAQVDPEADQWWLLDADFGVVIPLARKEIEEDPTVIRPYYCNRGYLDEEIGPLVEIFGKEDNVRFDDVSQYSPRKYAFEKATYFLVWIIPIALMAPLGVRLRLHRRRAGGRFH